MLREEVVFDVVVAILKLLTAVVSELQYYNMLVRYYMGGSYQGVVAVIVSKRC